MLAALIATRHVGPPPAIFYSNRTVAAQTTFTIVTVTRTAGQIPLVLPSPPISVILTLSLPGQESLLDQLNRLYYILVGPVAIDGSQLLSDTIAQVISTAAIVASIITTLPVSSSNASLLLGLQARLRVATSVLKSLAVPPSALSFAS